MRCKNGTSIVSPMYEGHKLRSFRRHCAHRTDCALSHLVHATTGGRVAAVVMMVHVRATRAVDGRLC